MPTTPATSERSAPAWHTLDAETVLTRLDSVRTGLDPDDAARRLESVGRNELVDKGSKPAARILWEQVTAFMVVLLIGAALLSLAIGKFVEAGAIGAIVVLFAILGFVQEYRAERAIAALRRLAVPLVRVERGGRVMEVSAVDLVPGDVVLLEAGNVVPADLRLLEVANLRIEEAALTGESEPVEKDLAVLDDDRAPLGDRKNLAFSGTQVTYGRGVGVVVSTGMGTELGHIAALIQGVAPAPTPLQLRLDRVGKQLAIAGAGVAVLMILIGRIGGESWSDLVLTAISVAVAVIPEGLPAVVTLTLAIGAQRMLRRQALVRRLPAVETLGSVTVICSDKTGTLTQNRMTVTVLEASGHRSVLGEHDRTEPHRPATLLALTAGALCNDAEFHVSDDGEVATIGDPTETALLVAAHEVGIDVAGLRSAHPRTDELPFDSERKRMSTVHGPLADDRRAGLEHIDPAENVAIVKGAPDSLLRRTTGVWVDGRVEPLDDDELARIVAANDALAADGVRVLAVAYRPIDHHAPGTDPEDDLVLIGLVGIVDPPRTEARDAVTTCREAGVRVVMITGDHPLTARAIARDLGIVSADDDRPVVTGRELDDVDDTALRELARSTSVFARVSPEHKLRIVEALRADGQVVAMTGDGVNDAPALRRADIGVAMGVTGTDVSKEAADMVLRDDNFATIVAAVEEGRVIYDNLRRFVNYSLAGNVGKILVLLLWPLLMLLAGETKSFAVALLPLQLLWLNLMTDGLLGLAMGTEQAEPDVMRRPPIDPASSIWSEGWGARTVWVGVVIGAVALALGAAFRNVGDIAYYQTMIFTSIAFMQVAQAIANRSTKVPLYRLDWRGNPTLLVMAVGVVGMQVLVMYVPFMRRIFDLAPLSVPALLLCVAAAILLLIVIEIVEAAQRRRTVSPARA
ncbi:MAG: cation-translocating P-type ATPase [Actinomycetes bacterium]